MVRDILGLNYKKILISKPCFKMQHTFYSIVRLGFVVKIKFVNDVAYTILNY